MPRQRKTGGVRREYEFIKAYRKQFPVELMCREVGVAPSGYYQWGMYPQSKRAI